MRSIIYSTIINPPLIFGLTTGLAFFMLFMLFVSVILLPLIVGVPGTIIVIIAVIYFYFYSCKRTATDPYWLNIVLMALIFERRKPLKFLVRVISKKDKILYR
jgi:hypothetical protein